MTSEVWAVFKLNLKMQGVGLRVRTQTEFGNGVISERVVAMRLRALTSHTCSDRLQRAEPSVPRCHCLSLYTNCCTLETGG